MEFFNFFIRAWWYTINHPLRPRSHEVIYCSYHVPNSSNHCAEVCSKRLLILKATGYREPCDSWFWYFVIFCLLGYWPFHQMASRSSSTIELVSDRKGETWLKLRWYPMTNISSLTYWGIKNMVDLWQAILHFVNGQFCFSIIKVFNWQKVSIGAGNCLVSNRRQAIIWTNDDSVHWRVHVASTPRRPCVWRIQIHYDDVIMGAMASQITSLTIVYSTVYSGADHSKH